MKHTMLFAIVALSAVCCSAEDKQAVNLLPNGSFEETRKIAKGSSKYILDRVRKGWDLGNGPVAEMPAQWTIDNVVEKISMRVVSKDDPAEKDNVKDGSRALKFTGAGSFYNGQKFQPGRYRLKFWLKGKGEVNFFSFNSYNWVSRTQPSPHKTQAQKLIRVIATPQWKEYTVETEFGKDANPPCDFWTLYINMTKAESLYFDNIIIEKLDAK